MKTKLNIKPKLCIAAILAAGLITPTHEALAKAKKTVSGLQKANQILEAENAQLRQQLADSQIKQQELLKAVQAKPVEKPAAMGHDMSHMDHDMGAMDMGHDMSAMGHDMGQMKMEPGDQMQFNPVLSGTEFFHNHPKGMWMFNTKYMHMQMNGLQAGTSQVNPSQVGPAVVAMSPVKNVQYPYMMIPTNMYMDMYMLMPMYGVTDRLTLMAMINYQTAGMDMLMDMGNMRKGGAYHSITQDSPMNTFGLADSEVDATFKIDNNWAATLGIGIPTGSIYQQIAMMGTTYRAPYNMQNGAGTVSLKPSLTYHYITKDALWLFGGQTTYTAYIGNNDNGWSRGNNIKVSGWIQRAFGPATTWLRLTNNNWESIHGHDTEIDKLQMGAPTPDAYTGNYGGNQLDLLFGAAYKYNAFSFGVEGGAPVYKNLNGLQMSPSWLLNASFQAMF